jgi:ABC-type phosphonate transport system ATPase subunit
MAGGSGSGVRMSEAEISRIMGGRSHWEALRASAQAWNPNNAEANKITPDQRKQIRSLANALNQKINAKRELVTRARRKLTESSIFLVTESQL